MRHYLVGLSSALVLTACVSSGDGGPETATTIKRNGDLVIGTVSRAVSDEELQDNEDGILCRPEEVVTDLFIARNEDGGARVSARCLRA